MLACKGIFAKQIHKDIIPQTLRSVKVPKVCLILILKIINMKVYYAVTIKRRNGTDKKFVVILIPDKKHQIFSV